MEGGVWLRLICFVSLQRAHGTHLQRANTFSPFCLFAPPSLLNTAVHTARQLCKDPRLVAGGGASEMELAHRLRVAADACKGLEMYSMKKFAESCAFAPCGG